MTTKDESLVKTAVWLPPKDRAYVAEQLLASLDETDLEQRWAAETKRCGDEVRPGRVKAIERQQVTVAGVAFGETLL